MPTTGRCHCGAITYSAEGAAEHHALCHCVDCRVWSGAPMAGWIAWKEDRVTISGEPVTYTSSEHGRRDFCGTCGTGLFYRNAEYLPGIIDIHSGTLDDYAAYPPGAQIMAKDRVAWMDSVEDLPRFETYPSMG